MRECYFSFVFGENEEFVVTLLFSGPIHYIVDGQSVFRVNERKLLISKAILCLIFFITMSLCINLLPLLMHGNQWDKRIVDFILHEQQLWQLTLYYEIASLSQRIRFLVPRLCVCIVYAMRVIIKFLASAFTMWKNPAGFVITKRFKKKAKERLCISQLISS